MVGPSAVRRDADALGRPAVVRAGPRRRAIGQRGRIATLPGPWSGDRDTKTQAAAPVTSQTSARPLTRHVDVVVANPPYEADNCDPRSLLLGWRHILSAHASKVSSRGRRRAGPGDHS